MSFYSQRELPKRELRTFGKCAADLNTQEIRNKSMIAFDKLHAVQSHGQATLKQSTGQDNTIATSMHFVGKG